MLIYLIQLKTLTRALMSSLSFACGLAAMPPNGIWAMSFQESGTPNIFLTVSSMTGL